MSSSVTDGVEWTAPKEGQKSGWGTFKRGLTPYDRWMDAQEIPIYRSIGLNNVRELPLKPWKLTGGNATFIQLYGTEGKYGMQVVEVPAGGSLNVQQHMWEDIIYVVEGRGSTEVWQTDERHKKVFEWSAGSLFVIPLNAKHRIVNATNDPALLLMGTTAPNIINLVQNTDFVFNCNYAFTDQFDEQDDYYEPKEDLLPDPVRGLAMQRTNIIPDLANCELPLDNRRSPGYRRIEPHMASETFYLFCGQHESGRYSKAHAHTSGAVLICLSGHGFSHTWPRALGTTPWADGHGDKVQIQEYVPGGMISAAPMTGDWFHQHFGTSAEPLRLLVFVGTADVRRRGGTPGEVMKDYSSIDVKKGGVAIEYRDEDPHVREEYERRLTASGGVSRMTQEVYDAEFEFSTKSPHFADDEHTHES